MLGLIVGLLLIWLIITCIGIAIKGLFWLFIVGIVLFALTTAFGAFSTTR